MTTSLNQEASSGFNGTVVDYGAGDHRVWCGPFGVFPMPKPPKEVAAGGPAAVFTWEVEQQLKPGHVATESSTPWSSGADAEKLDLIVRHAEKTWGHKLFIISGRAVKNSIGTGITNQQAAMEQYRIASDPNRLKEWKYVHPDDKLVRKHTSVRPYDQMNYNAPQVDEFMKVMPHPNDLPDEIKLLLLKRSSSENRMYTVKRGTKGELQYDMPRTLPLAMAMDEPSVTNWNTFERVLGSYEHGYPTFYRRCVTGLMEHIAYIATEKKRRKSAKNDPDVPSLTYKERKDAWKVVDRGLTMLYAIMKERKANMIVGSIDPETGEITY